MAGGGAFSPSGEVSSLATNLNLTTGHSQSSHQLLDDDEGNCLEIDGEGIESAGDDLFRINDDDHALELNEDNRLLEIIGNDPRDPTVGVDNRSCGFDGKEYPPPVAGMEFDSYEDAYNYYNCYARELGFAIRVKSSWTKRNSKEKRGAVLCCNCEGFKTVKEVGSRRRETRTGCLAMIRLRLVESNRWRVDEVKLEHNHLFDPARAKNSKSHKKMDGAKHNVEPNLDVEVQTIKLYRTPVNDVFSYGSSIAEEREIPVSQTRCLKLNKGDARVINDYFCRSQLADPNFLYLMDLNEEGRLRNVFWIDARSRAAYNYFGDVVAFDTTCLSKSYGVPLFAFVGVNHHGGSVLLGCGLIAEETVETYIWLFRAWLTCMFGRPPQTIVSNHCKAMQDAIAEVFPRASHRFFLSRLMESIVSNVGPLHGPDSFLTSLEKVVRDSLSVEDFEIAWEDMIQRWGLRGHEWLQTLYDSREKWAPVYMKDVLLAGIGGFQRGTDVRYIFEGYIQQGTSLQELFSIYELVLDKNRQKEALDDSKSRHVSFSLRTGCYYELQLSRLYTETIFTKFQQEVMLMSSCCVNVTQVHVHGSITTYHVKECEVEGHVADVRNFEVTYDKTGGEVRCICGCFDFNGYLCRHALCVLNYNGVEEIPPHYVLTRWRKDVCRLYVPDFGSNNVDTSNPVQRSDHLYRKAMQVVEEGIVSEDHFVVARQAFKESLNEDRLVGEKHL